MTILFADVAGSTALGEELDPEDLRALLARCYAIASEVIGLTSFSVGADRSATSA